LDWLPDELRLAVTVALSVFAFVAAFRFARRLTGRSDWIANAADAWLIFLVIQYLAVCGPGLLGILNPLTMSLAALLAAGALNRFARPRALTAAAATEPVSRSPGTLAYAEPSTRRWSTLDWRHHAITVACLLFLLGYYYAIVDVYKYSPVLVDDALTYHIPAAVQWLMSGHVGLYTTWFFNPANTYSPLAGSTFIAWLIGPISNDVLVRFVQVQPLMMMFFGLVELCRALGVRANVAAVVALAAVLSRPLLSQSFEVKDDLFAAAFFLAAVEGLAPRKVGDRLGPWRVGAALGLFAATKYTALLSAPIFLLLIDAPFRARWSLRRWLIAIGSAAALAGPWYLRNWIVAGNPLYPVPIGGLPGLFVTLRSIEMTSVAGVLDCITDRKDKFHSPSPALLAVLAIGCVAALVVSCVRRGALGFLRDPLRRAVVLGPVLGFALFIAVAHAGEMRYLYPSLLLLFACAAVAIDIDRLPEPACIAVAVALATLAAWGSFNNKEFVRDFSRDGAIAAILGTSAIFLGGPLFARRRHGLRWAAAVAALVLACAVYVYWPAYVLSNRENADDLRITTQGTRAELWKWVNHNLPADATVAYTNLFMVHPMLGFDHRRTLLYAPTRPGVHAYHDLPPSHRPLTDQQIRAFCAEQLTADADRATWTKNLASIKPQYLIVGSQDVLPVPPERDWAEQDPSHFVKLFENAAGAVYQIAGG
jgi:hypothetical protein